MTEDEVRKMFISAHTGEGHDVIESATGDLWCRPDGAMHVKLPPDDEASSEAELRPRLRAAEYEAEA